MRVVWLHTRQPVASWKARVSAKQAADTPWSFGAAWLAVELTLCSIFCAWPVGSAGLVAVLTSCSTLKVIATAAALLAVTAAPCAAFCIANCCHFAALPGCGKVCMAVSFKVQAGHLFPMRLYCRKAWRACLHNASCPVSCQSLYKTLKSMQPSPSRNIYATHFGTHVKQRLAKLLPPVKRNCHEQVSHKLRHLPQHMAACPMTVGPDPTAVGYSQQQLVQGMHMAVCKNSRGLPAKP